MTLAKVCGIRTVEEGSAALEAGADMLGFVIWPHSKRAVTVEQAAEIVAALRQHHQVWQAVGVFVDPTLDEVRTAADGARLDVVQLSGHEPPDLVAQVPRPVLKAVHVQPGEERQVAMTVGSNCYGADAYLLDTGKVGWYGGTGETFAWELLREVGAQCFVAGGLRPDNVVGALTTLRPKGVDVSSGVERPGGGKDPLLVRQFVEQVKEFDRVGR